ncbi:MAG: CHAT domain-containing protein [Cyanobacteria bacterium SBLK]|nr:CHAT domain-containing protein [Cyanobacteria bacterium SBLK]
MKKFVFLKIGQGDFDRGFPVILKIASPDLASLPEVEIDCELPPNSQIQEIYENWLDASEKLPFTKLMEEKKAREHYKKCYDSAKQLKSNVKTWLSSSTNLKFQRMREILYNRLDASYEIFVFLQTNHKILTKLPWQEWDLWSDRFPKSEIALSPLEIESVSREKFKTGQNSIKILSILGDRTGIDIEKDREIIQALPKATPEFLVEPDRQEFSYKLWEKSWNILFFAGHSTSKNESGVINLNPKDKLPIEDLRNSLKKVRNRGLQLAIFNSCDGLKLAEYLAELNIPQIIVMRELVPDKVAQLFLEYFLEAYSGGESLYLAVRQARSRLEAIEKDFPSATWIPMIYQKSLDIPPTWEEIVHGDPPSLFKKIDSIIEKYYHPETLEYPRIPVIDQLIELSEEFRMSTYVIFGIKVAFCSNHKEIFFATTWYGELKIWNLESRNTKHIMPCPFSVLGNGAYCIAISPDNRTIATCDTYRLLIWRLGEVKPIYEFAKTLLSNYFDLFSFEALSFSPDGEILATNNNQDIDLINTKTGKKICTLTGHTNKVTCAVFHPHDSRILASCSHDTTIKIWNIDTAKSMVTLTGHHASVFTLAFSPDGEILASGGKDNTIQLWSIYSGKLPTTLRLHSDGITDLVFSPEGGTLISSSYDGTIREWTKTGKHLYAIDNAHKRGVTSIALSPDGQTLISGGRDRTIKIWQRQRSQ